MQERFKDQKRSVQVAILLMTVVFLVPMIVYFVAYSLFAATVNMVDFWMFNLFGMRRTK